MQTVLLLLQALHASHELLHKRPGPRPVLMPLSLLGSVSGPAQPGLLVLSELPGQLGGKSAVAAAAGGGRDQMGPLRRCREGTTTNTAGSAGLAAGTKAGQGQEASAGRWGKGDRWGVSCCFMHCCLLKLSSLQTISDIK